MENNIHVSENIRSLKVAEDKYVLWNRFFPTVLKLNGAAINLLETLQHTPSLEFIEKNKQFIYLLTNYYMLHCGKLDPSKKLFKESVKDQVNKLSDRLDNFFKAKKDYDQFNIVNDTCNLNCLYCVREYKRNNVQRLKDAPEKLRIMNKCIDQFFENKLKNNSRKARISFNGGEILMEWRLIKTFIERITKKYQQMDITFSLNTNMTIMTKEIAEFLSHYKFSVYISIDGYKNSHDKTRVYKNGKSSFDDIIKALEIYRKYCKNYFIEGFQGTIDFIDDFDPEEVYSMEKYGFNSARLAPNLLNVTEEDAKKKAGIMARFFDLNKKYNLKVTEVIFANWQKLINLDKYNFFFNCNGLSSFPFNQLALNIDTAQISLLCSFISRAAVSLDELDNNIYNQKLWDKAKAFIEERVAVLLDYCQSCSIIGICRGGCIYSGLDKENQVNLAACAYQKQLWDIYLEKVYAIEEQGGKND